MVRESANKEDDNFGIADTQRPAFRGTFFGRRRAEPSRVDTQRNRLQTKFSAGVPPCRSRRYSAKRSVTARTIVATARDVQIRASCGSNGAVTYSQICFTAFAVQSV
jgi:hypothetical protein